MNKFLILGILISLSSISYGNDLNDDLIKAVSNGNLKEVKALVASGANVNTEEGYGKTVLMFALEKGHLDIVKYFVEEGADINIEDNNGTSVCRKHKTALTWAIDKGYGKIVEYLKNKMFMNKGEIR